jgi:hypothetical protein
LPRTRARRDASGQNGPARWLEIVQCPRKRSSFVIQSAGHDKAAIAWPDLARMSAAVKNAVGQVGKLDRRPARIGEEVDATGRLSCARYCSVGVERLENPLVRGQNVGARPGKVVDGRGRLRQIGQLRRKSSEVRQDVAHPPPAERQGVDRNRPGARHLGPDDSQACASRRRCCSARIAAIVDRDHHRRAKCANGRLIAGMLLLIADRLDDGARDDREG